MSALPPKADMCGGSRDVHPRAHVEDGSAAELLTRPQRRLHTIGRLSVSKAAIRPRLLEDRKSARPCPAAGTTRPRRRDNRIEIVFAAKWQPFLTRHPAPDALPLRTIGHLSGRRRICCIHGLKLLRRER